MKGRWRIVRERSSWFVQAPLALAKPRLPSLPLITCRLQSSLASPRSHLEEAAGAGCNSRKELPGAALPRALHQAYGGAEAQGAREGSSHRAPFTWERRHAAKQPNQTGSSRPSHTDASSSGLSGVRLTCCRRSHQAPHSQAQVVEQPHRVTKERGAAHHLGQLRQQAAHVVALRQGRGCREAGEHITALPTACRASAGPVASNVVSSSHCSSCVVTVSVPAGVAHSARRRTQSGRPHLQRLRQGGRPHEWVAQLQCCQPQACVLHICKAENALQPLHLVCSVGEGAGATGESRATKRSEWHGAHRGEVIVRKAAQRSSSSSRSMKLWHESAPESGR